MERPPIVSASVPKIASQDWLFGNPWSWLVLGLACCTAAWICAGSSWQVLRLALIAAGLLSVALAVQWNVTQPYLGRMFPFWRGAALLALAAIFHFLAMGLSRLLILSFLWPEAAFPWRWGPMLLCWLVVAPMSAIAGRQCYRRIREANVLRASEETALLLLLAALACQIAVAAMYDRARPLDLDTIRFFLGVVTLIAIVAAPLVLVPTTVRLTVVSLVIVFHFISVGAAALLNFKSSMVVVQFTSRLSRPYLDFFVVGNPHAYFVEE